MDSVKLREILVEVAQGGAKALADPEAFECAVNGGLDAIMSAFKRAPGVVVKELEWGGIDYPYAKAAEFGYGYGIGEDEGIFWVSIEGASFPNPLIAQTFDTLEAAKAACQADFAKRITSAVEPSCVVTGDAVERAVDTFESEVRKEQDYNPLHAGITNAVIMHKVLTAALSSRTEEDPSARQVGEHWQRELYSYAAGLEGSGDRVGADIVRDACRYVRARSLTNGGE